MKTIILTLAFLACSCEFRPIYQYKMPLVNVKFTPERLTESELHYVGYYLPRAFTRLVECSYFKGNHRQRWEVLQSKADKLRIHAGLDVPVQDFDKACGAATVGGLDIWLNFPKLRDPRNFDCTPVEILAHELLHIAGFHEKENEMEITLFACNLNVPVDANKLFDQVLEDKRNGKY